MRQLTHPYNDLTGGQWVRGNLHTHSLQSDGVRLPQEVIDDYAARGYDFLELSDHDIFTSEEKYREWDSKGMILIPGNEISRGGPHLHHVDADRFIEPFTSRQEVFNAINAAARESGRGFAIVNHPNWGAQFEHATIEQMREWTGYVGLEIYNGVIGRLHGSPYATNKWDILLTEGRRLWGFANDDSHQAGDVALGWNVAYVKERSVAAVVEALRNGRFYASTGVVISSISVDGDTIRIETENARRIVALCDAGRRFKTVDEASIEVKVPADASYVRFECWGDGESFAWTQPFFNEKEDPEAKGGGLNYLQDWQVSAVQEEGTLAAASPDQAAAQSATPVTCLPATHHGAGFVDVRRIINNTDGIVYLSSEYESEHDAAQVLRLGFDGPVRVWVNGQPVYYGPGLNLAEPDAVAVFADFREGINNIVIALGTNKGKACGIFARVQ